MNFESAGENMNKHKRRTPLFNRNRSIRKNEKRLLLLWDDANSSLTNKISTDKKGLSGRVYLFFLSYQWSRVVAEGTAGILTIHMVKEASTIARDIISE